jgi:hypothetical protein
LLESIKKSQSFIKNIKLIYLLQKIQQKTIRPSKVHLISTKLQQKHQQPIALWEAANFLLAKKLQNQKAQPQHPLTLIRMLILIKSKRRWSI